MFINIEKLRIGKTMLFFAASITLSRKTLEIRQKVFKFLITKKLAMMDRISVFKNHGLLYFVYLFV